MEVRLTDPGGNTTSLPAAAGRIGDLLGLVGGGGADHATVVSGDGYRASIPLDVLRSGGVMTVEDGGLRLRVESGATLCWNVKDVVALELTIGRARDDVPENPSH